MGGLSRRLIVDTALYIGVCLTYSCHVTEQSVVAMMDRMGIEPDLVRADAFRRVDPLELV